MFGSFGKIVRKCVVYLLFLIVGAGIGMHGLETLAAEIWQAFDSFFMSIFHAIFGGSSPITIK